MNVDLLLGACVVWLLSVWLRVRSLQSELAASRATAKLATLCVERLVESIKRNEERRFIAGVERMTADLRAHVPSAKHSELN